MIVGERQVNMHVIAIGRDRVEPRLCSPGQRQCGGAARGIHNANVLHEHAALEAGADSFGERLFGGKALGIGAGAGERAARGLGAFDIGEDACLETLAKAVERRLDALDVAQVGAEADDHIPLLLARRRSLLIGWFCCMVTVIFTCVGVT